MPAVMKAIVATSERVDFLAKPQMPCPLVQPLPREVPNPVRIPPMTRTIMGASIVIEGIAPGDIR